MENNDLHDHTESPVERDVWKTLRNLSVRLWDYRFLIGMALACLLLAKVATVLVPITLKSIVNWFDPAFIIEATNWVPIVLIVALGLLGLASTLFEQLRNALFSQAQQRAVRNIGFQVFQHLHQLSHAFHQKRPTDGILRDIERGTRGINQCLWHIVFNLLPTVFEILVICIILALVFELKFVLITAAVILAYFCFTFYATRWRRDFRVRLNDAESRANSTGADALLNYETVKYFCNEEYEYNRFDLQMREWEKQSVIRERTLALQNLGQKAIFAIGTILLLYLAGKGVVTRDLTLGDFVMLNAFLVQMYLPLRYLGTAFREVNHALTDMERLFGLLDIDNKIPETEEERQLEISKAEIKLENVGFGYSEDQQILHDVSFEVSSGQKIALVGTNGAGKSTLVRLLFRFYDVTKGRILIDGQDIREVSSLSVRSAIGVVPQDTALFNESIEYNIRYGAPDCTDSEFTAAVKQANLYDFVEALPEKYDTIVGERVLELSSEEKQRISIARAILKDPPILVLEEPITSLDSKSETIIQTELDAIAKNRTTLVIAQRLSTIVDADRILVLDQGEIVEQGTHAELLEMNGLFADMWWLQQVEETADAQIAELAASISLGHS